MSRPVSRIITAHRQTEGEGFVVRRSFPSPSIDMVDPFVLLDHLGPLEYPPGKALGTPDHPHRGFEIVSYVIEGEVEHIDSEGHTGSLGPGDVQWMTAGAGIVHSEMPSRRVMEQGGRGHGFQIWVNLPARDKMMKPRYQEIPAATIPQVKSQDGKVHVRVIAGEALGARALIETRTPILHQHWTLQPGATVDQPVPSNYNVMAYVFMGEGLIGAEAKAVKESQLAILGPGDTVRLACAPTAQQPLELMLLGGVPLNEPVARYGPFVMNTREELMQAFEDFQAGRMGRIRR